MRLPVTRARVAGAAVALAVAALAAGAVADDPPSPFTDADILDKPPPYFRVEAVNVRFTEFDQAGHGYQSRAGPVGGPGDEALTVQQPQLEVIAKQGDKITHRLWVPVDVVTNASPDAIDVISTASHNNFAGSIDYTMTYKATPETSAAVRIGAHNEENFRSWNLGFSLVRSFAEDNTVLEASANEVADWFDRFTLAGDHDGQVARSSSNGNLGLTQLLSPTTIAHLDYGITIQHGQLSNGWNIVPLTSGDVALEILPGSRTRQAFVGRVAQWLPWNGAAHAFYRFYADDWGIRAHTLEFELHQRLSRISYLRATYRFHRQTGASFFTTRSAPGFTTATADSDLAPFDAQTLGVMGAVDVPVRFARNLHADVSVERYFRTNDLRVSVYSCGLGFLF
jgi:Protein of unknown function (DUF3570)